MDFIGFTYDGKHSFRDLGIYRTSDGSRYNDNLVPQMTEKTAEIPGGDGQYYFNTTHKTRQFAIPIAFDHLTEVQYRAMRNWLNGKKIAELVFDEAPYKAYSAKVTGTPSLKTLCFEEGGQRVYKGEGTIQFTCYYPYAHTPKHLWTVNSENEWFFKELDGKNIDRYQKEAYPNKAEWKEASGLDDNIRIIKGDIDTYMKYTLTIAGRPTSSNPTCKSLIIYYYNEDKTVREKTFEVEFYNPISIQANDQLVWDTKTGLIYHLRGDQKTLCPYKGNGIVPLVVGTRIDCNYSVQNAAGLTLPAMLEYDFLYI